MFVFLHFPLNLGFERMVTDHWVSRAEGLVGGRHRDNTP